MLWDYVKWGNTAGKPGLLFFFCEVDLWNVTLFLNMNINVCKQHILIGDNSLYDGWIKSKEMLFPLWCNTIAGALFWRTAQTTLLKTQLFIIRMNVIFYRSVSKDIQVYILHIDLALVFWLVFDHFLVKFMSIFFRSWSQQSHHNCWCRLPSCKVKWKFQNDATLDTCIAVVI